MEGSAWEEAGPQLLLWSGLQAEQHLLVDRCRAMTALNSCPPFGPKLLGGAPCGAAARILGGHVHADERKRKITNNNEEYRKWCC